LAASQEDLTQLFHLPLSKLAYNQLMTLDNEIQNLNRTNSKDIWGYSWGSDIFSTTKAYKELISQGRPM
jgi:hypothetical protein